MVTHLCSSLLRIGALLTIALFSTSYTLAQSLSPDGSALADEAATYAVVSDAPMLPALRSDKDMTKTAPETAQVGQMFEYTLTVGNANTTSGGPFPISNVQVVDVLPAQVRYVSHIITKGTCTVSGQTVTCNIGNMDANETVTITITVEAVAAGTARNEATVTSTEFDPDIPNNTDDATTTIEQASMPGSISGFKWNDLNGNGVFDDDTGLLNEESRLPGWIIYIDQNRNGMRDATEPFLPTDADGRYTFAQLEPGTYVIREELQDGWTQTLPSNAGASEYLIVLQEGENRDNVNFGNYRGISISGRKFEDRNGNGMREPDEPGLDGWTIELRDEEAGLAVVASTVTSSVDLNSDGVIDPLTESGFYHFENIPPFQRTFFLTEVLQVGWVPTVPGVDDVLNVFGHSVVPLPGEHVEDVLFGNYKHASIGGRKFEDRNSNGIQDVGEPGLANWEIRLTGQDNLGNIVDMTVVTLDDVPATPDIDEAGIFLFSLLAPGTYTLSEVLQDNWFQTFPQGEGTHTVTILSGDAPNEVNFGNRRRQADLQVTKVANRTSFRRMDEAIYTITVTNNGPDVAREVQLRDVFQGNNVKILELTPNQGCIILDDDANPNVDVFGEITCSLGDLEVGATRELTLRVQLTDLVQSINTALVEELDNGRTFDPDTTNNGSSAIIALAQADLQVTKTADKDRIGPGAEVTYTIEVRNNGPDPALTPVLTDTFFGNNARILSFEPNEGCTIEDDDANPNVDLFGKISCVLDRLDPNEAVTFTLRAVLPELITSTNLAQVDEGDGVGTIYDPNTDNNGNSAIVEVSQVGLSVVKNADLSIAKPGEPITFTIDVSNAGPGDATNVNVIDFLPGGFMLDQITASQGTCFPTSTTCELGTLAANATATVTVVARATDQVPIGTTVSNRAVVNSNEAPSLEATAEVTIEQTRTELIIVKTASETQVPRGRVMSFTIVVRNDGPDPATNVLVSDFLPNGFQFFGVDPSPACGPSASQDRVTCLFETLGIGESQTITLSVIPEFPGSYTNTATVTADQPDGNLLTNSSSAMIEVVQPNIDLMVSKVVSDEEVVVGDTVTFTVVVKNIGTDVARDVIIDEDPSFVFRRVSLDIAPGTCDLDERGAGARCRLPELAPGDSTVITLAARITRTGRWANEAFALSGEAQDVNTDDNTDVARVNATPLTITMPEDPDEAQVALRAALQLAEDLELDDIIIEFPVVGGSVIRLRESLPQVRRRIRVRSVPRSGGLAGTKQNDQVVIDGSECEAPCSGLVLAGGFSEVNGITFQNFPDYGLVLQDSSQNVVQDVTLSGNGQGGLHIVASDDNLIGGDGEQVGNTITSNSGPGIFIESGEGNSIRRNAIFDNAALGLDLGAPGVTPNDADEADGVQNYPVITQVSGDLMTIEGELTSTPNTRFVVDMYSNTVCDDSEHGEGQIWLTSLEVTTPLGSNTIGFTAQLDAPLGVGERVTVTATNERGSTSEFSPCGPALSTPIESVDNAIPAAYQLFANYPNPFTRTTVFQYAVPQASAVRLAVYDVLGRRVTTIVDRMHTAGTHRIAFNADDLPSGLYMVRMEANTFKQARTFVIAR